MKLRAKFSILTGSLVILVVAGVSIFLFIAEKRFLVEEMKTNQINTIKGLAQVSEESFIAENEILLLNYVKLIRKTRGVVYAMLTDVKGKILAHTDYNLLGNTVTDVAGVKTLSANKLFVQTYFDKENREIFDIALPVFTGGKKQGLARIGFSQSVIHEIVEETLNKIRRRIFGVAVAVLIFGVAGAMILAAMMTVPIKKMAQGAMLIGQGKLNTVIEVKGKDELSGLAKDLNIMAKKLKELDRMKQDFVSSITHEFRAPLNAMGIHFDLFFKGHLGALTKEQKESLTILKNNTTRLGRFINDLLDIAKIERGKMEINKQDLNLSSLIREIFQLYKVQTDQKKIEFKIQIQENLPGAFADPDRIRQILNNLVSNAIKFTPEQGIITISAAENEEFLVVSIKDSGIGIPGDQIDKIFDKFEQVKGIREKVKGQKGTGLGLTIAKILVERQGGKIRVESELGKGSIFYFTIQKKKK